MRIASWGHAAFAAVLIALGLQGLITGQLTALWQPIPKWAQAGSGLGYFCGFISLSSGAGLLFRRTAAPAARTLLGVLLAWCAVFRLPPILHAPAALLSWYGLAEPAVMVAATWVLYAWFADDWDRKHLGFAIGERAIRGARVTYGLCLIPFGIAHFTFIQRTAGMVPGWLPAHMFWAMFFGGTFIAAGAGIVLGVLARLAASLSAFQIGLFNVLVWLPTLAAATRNPYDWVEAATSVAIMAGGWVVADSYRDVPWNAVGRR